MSDPRSALGARPAGILIAAAALSGPVLAMAPLGMSSLLIAAAVLATGVARLSGEGWPSPPLAMSLGFGAVLLWSAISLAWDINIGAGALKLLDLAAVWISLAALIGLSDRMTTSQRDRFAMALAGGLAVGLAVLSFETTFDYPLHRLIMGNNNPRLVDLLESKRAVDALPMLIWPTVIALARLGKPRLAVILALVFTSACTRWTASSALLGMAAALVVLLMATLSVTAARRTLATLVVAAFALMVPAALTVYDHGGSTASWIKFSGKHRLEIWHFASERILERPLSGHGFDSSRFIPNGSEVSAFQPAGKPIIPLHPHNAFLQVWLELGFVGVLLVVIPILSPLGATAGFRDADARFALAAYAAGIVIAGLAFGILQSWWMATLCFSALAIRTVARRVDNG
jgi:O-antigen ligase